MTIHAITRAGERYSIPLTIAELVALEMQIATNQSLLVEKKSTGVSVHVVKHGEIPMVCVVGNNGCIITFLPPDSITAGGRAKFHAGKGDPRKRRRKPRFR